MSYRAESACTKCRRISCHSPVPPPRHATPLYANHMCNPCVTLVTLRHPHVTAAAAGRLTFCGDGPHCPSPAIDIVLVFDMSPSIVAGCSAAQFRRIANGVLGSTVDAFGQHALAPDAVRVALVGFGRQSVRCALGLLVALLGAAGSTAKGGW